jgi:hypothetical protein
VSSHSESGPAIATTRPSIRRTHGTIWPYPNRNRSSQDISMAPARPSMIRTITGGWPLRGSMKSVTRAAPSAVCQSVSSTSVSPWYRRVTSRGPVPAGAIRQNPFCSPPSRPAKQAGESKRGTHSQSADPSLLMSAADCISPMIA